MPQTQHTPAASHPRSLLRQELAEIADRFEAADRRAKRASTIPAREEAEAERRAALGEHWQAESELAELCLLLLRLALRHQPDALRLYLADALRPELEPLVQAVARMEGRL
jgi:hypothetical protein